MLVNVLRKGYKMKPIEELGISLSPWVKYGDIVEDAEGNVIFNAYDDSDFQNAHLIAEAPEMYECLREAVEEKCHGCSRLDNGKCTKESGACFVQRWRAALEKAGGAEWARQLRTS